MTHTPEPAFRNLDQITSIADGLDQNVQIDPQTSEDEPGGYRSELDELMADAASILRSQHARIAELEAENKSLRILASGGIDLFERYSTFKAKCEELEAMLDAVGAGGVGESIKPQIQADTAPQPTRQPMTDEKLYALYCEAMKGYYVSALHYWRETEAHKFARAIEAAVANQSARQPLTEEHIYRLYSNAMRGYWVESFHHWRLKKRNEAREFARAVEFAHGITGGQP